MIRTVSIFVSLANCQNSKDTTIQFSSNSFKKRKVSNEAVSTTKCVAFKNGYVKQFKQDSNKSATKHYP